MKKVLLVSATSMEIQPTLDFLKDSKTEQPGRFVFNNLQISVCLTGVGMTNTGFTLGRLQGQHFDAAINVGVAGAFKHFQAGDVVNVIGDCFSELGAEDDLNFLKIDDLGLGKQMSIPELHFHNEVAARLPIATGITVNTVHGNSAHIQKVSELYQSDIETMEGAAFFLATNAFHIPALQIRAISNKVEKRNKDNWKMTLAIKNLNTTLIDVLKSIV